MCKIIPPNYYLYCTYIHTFSPPSTMSDERAPLLPDATNTITTARKRNMFWTVGAIYGATAVCLGAFGAHGLKKSISDPARIANWGTAAQYQVSA